MEKRRFNACTNLQEVSLPDTVTEINNKAFSLSGVTSLNLPDGLTLIDSMFIDCKELQEVSLPDSVTELPESIFKGCERLTSINWPKGGLTKIGQEAFYSCKDLQEVRLPDTVTEIGSRAFRECGLTSITLPESLKKTGEEVFLACHELKKATVPIAIEEIGSGLFRASGLTSVDLPDGLKILGPNMFRNCKDLKEVTIPGTVTEIGDEAFRESGLTNVELSDGLKILGSRMFSDCEDLKEVMIPDTVTEIGGSAFSASGLTSINLPDGLKRLENNVFYFCRDLHEVRIPDGIEEIGHRAFCDSGLRSIDLPENLKKIETEAFRLCRDLKEITLPDTVTEIGGNAFYQCDLISSITLSENLETIGQYAFADCPNLTRIVLSGATPPIVDNGAFGNTPSPRYMVLTGAATSGKYDEGWQGFTKTKTLEDEVTLPSIPDQTYTGSAFEPGIDIPGTKDTDYKVTCENNTNAGQATVHITADGCLGMYTGAADISFTINPAPGRAQVNLDSWTYGQAGNRPVPVSETNGTDQVTYAYKAKDAGDDTYQAEKPTAAGQYTVQASFAAVQNYEAVTATADFTIEKTQPVMTIDPEAGKEIQVGEPITLNITLRGVNGEKPEGTVVILDKTLTLKDGQASIAYTPADTKPITLTAAYTPADGENYTSAQANTTLEAGKKTREPIVINAAAKTYGDPDFTLTPTGGSLQPGEAYTYTSDNEAVAVVKADGTVTITGAGTAHITVSIVESSVWNPAEAVMPLVVAKATPAYDIPNLTAVYGQTLKDVALPEGFSWQDPEDTAVGNAGSNTFKVTYTPEDTANYQTVADIEVSIEVSKATPVYELPKDRTAVYGQILKDVALPAGFSWQDDESTARGQRRQQHL